MKKYATFLGFAMFITTVTAQEVVTPIQAYNSEVLFSLTVCPMKLELQSDWQTCISDAQKKTKTQFDEALKTIKKTAKRNALKEHYITSMAAIGSMNPESGEARMMYKQRQAQNKNKVEERWVRFELEN